MFLIHQLSLRIEANKGMVMLPYVKLGRFGFLFTVDGVHQFKQKCITKNRINL
jgi:hypothetical protein